MVNALSVGFRMQRCRQMFWLECSNRAKAGPRSKQGRKGKLEPLPPPRYHTRNKRIFLEKEWNK